MILYKTNNLILFFVIFLSLESIYSQPKYNQSDEYPPNNNIEPKKNDTDHSEFKEKEISLTFENDKLKIQLEVYNIYFYFLIILNALFLILLLSFFIYKLCFKSKETLIQNDIKNKILLNYIGPKKKDYKERYDDLQEESDKSLNHDNSFLNEELLNNSGIEAPPASKI